MKMFRLGWIPLCFLLTSCTAAQNTWRTYQLYEPELRHTTIYQGKYDPESKRLAYNHCAAGAFFRGMHYVIWQGNICGIEAAHDVHLWLSTSKDFNNWSEPVKFLCDPRTCENPFTDPTQQVQPGLLNLNDRELWCFYLHQDDPDDDGIYLSRLKPDGKWTNRRIMPAHIDIDSKPHQLYTSVNPCVFSSDRIALPVIAFSLDEVTIDRRGKPGKMPRRYNGVLYSDDLGATWQHSNFISHPYDLGAMWEPVVCEQIDGRLRMFVRNLYHPPNNQPQSNLYLTCSGSGVQKGTSMRFDPDVQISHMELFSDRSFVMKLSSGRYLMLNHDLVTTKPAFAERRNTAMYFSRSGSDDFVAGPKISRDNRVGSYPQAYEAADKIYAVYTTGSFRRKPDPHTMEISIEGVCVDPAPSAETFYLWPRDRTYVDAPYQRPVIKRVDDKPCLLFKKGATAGVETDPVFYDKGDILTVEMSFRIDKLQNRGKLILLSFGDRDPVRIGILSNRPDTLYAYTARGFQPVARTRTGQWQKLSVTFSPNRFTVQLENQPQAVFEYPANHMSPRLYLGDGYEIDRNIRSNNGSIFLINLPSIRTRVTSQ